MNINWKTNGLMGVLIGVVIWIIAAFIAKVVLSFFGFGDVTDGVVFLMTVMIMMLTVAAVLLIALSWDLAERMEREERPRPDGPPPPSHFNCRCEDAPLPWDDDGSVERLNFRKSDLHELARHLYGDERVWRGVGVSLADDPERGTT